MPLSSLSSGKPVSTVSRCLMLMPSLILSLSVEHARVAEMRARYHEPVPTPVPVALVSDELRPPTVPTGPITLGASSSYDGFFSHLSQTGASIILWNVAVCLSYCTAVHPSVQVARIQQGLSPMVTSTPITFAPAQYEPIRAANVWVPYPDLQPVPKPTLARSEGFPSLDRRGALYIVMLAYNY